MAKTDPIIINYDKATELSLMTIDMMHRGVYPFNRAENGFYTSGSRKTLFPDAIIPEGIELGSQEHALLLFYGCNSDKMRSADKVWQSLREMSQLGVLSKLHNISLEQIGELVRKHFDTNPDGLGNPRRTLYENSRKLHEEYQGDPRNLVASTIEETMTRIQGFYEYGPGKAALFLKGLRRFEFCDFNPSDLLIKVDIHVTRISIGAGVASTERESPRLDAYVNPLMHTYRKVTREKRISAIELDDALWLLGAKSCRRNNYVHCRDHCQISCKVRPRVDKQTSRIYPAEDMRREIGQLSLRI